MHYNHKTFATHRHHEQTFSPEHRSIEHGKPQQNSYIECFNRSYREDILDMYTFSNLSQVTELTIDWQIEYNHDRGHDSLGGHSPSEYAHSFSPFTPQQSGEGPKGKKLLSMCRTL